MRTPSSAAQPPRWSRQVRHPCQTTPLRQGIPLRAEYPTGRGACRSGRSAARCAGRCITTVSNEKMCGSASVGTKRFGRVRKLVAKPVVFWQIQHCREGCCPSVTEQLPAVVDMETGARHLEPAQSEEVESTAVVQLPDHGAARELRSAGHRRARSVLSHPSCVDDQRARWSRADQSVPGAAADMALNRIRRDSNKSLDRCAIGVSAHEPDRWSGSEEMVRNSKRSATCPQTDDGSLGVRPDTVDNASCGYRIAGPSV